LQRLCLLLLVAAGLNRSLSAQRTADLLLINGKIITVDVHDTVAEAIAIREGKILATGTTAEMRKLAAANARIIDLHGRTATPGLIDTHCHFDETRGIYAIELSDVRSIPEVQQRVRAKVSTLKPGEWVQGYGWDEGKLVERRYITAADLDKVAPDNPVWLGHTTGHYAVVNSYALHLAKVTADSKNPPAGTIDRDAQGASTGVLKESAMDLVKPLIPPFTPEQERNGILKMMAEFNREGMTAAKDPGITPEKWALYQQILNENKATVRVFALFLGGTSLETTKQTLAVLQPLRRPPQSYGDGMLLAGGVKFFMDGSGGGRTAWVYAPWFKSGDQLEAGNTGYPAIDPESYRKMVRLLHESGIHVSTHAVGDRAIDWVVDTYAEVLKEKPTRDLRHGLIHAVLPTEHAIATLAQLQKRFGSGYPEVQPPFLWWIGDLYASTFGLQRLARTLPLKTFQDRGILWTGGSDFFVTPYPARYGLWSAIARQTLTGKQRFGTGEAIDIRAALKAYTIWAAHQLFLENQIGSLEPGKDADIAVWDRDPYTVPTEALKDMNCELTLLRGKVVFEEGR
jgi:predicted amidohydrolase YtcJ